jgi:CubicO group peptidase (beta-lactamase class C family)
VKHWLQKSLIVVAFGASLAARADELTIAAKPESLGFSSARLARITQWFQGQVDAREFPGAVIAIARNGKLAYLEAIGFQDRGKQIPMQRDSIFWIASMTKPITSVAAMILVEEGKLNLDAPAAQYLPDLKDMQVASENTDPTTGLIELTYAPQKRPMTVRDLLRHTSGLIYPPQYLDTPIHRLYRKAVFSRNKTLADFVASLAQLPLAHQPGEVWEYSWGVDVLARIVELQSGQTFEEFLKTRVFDPLHMVDTGFYAPPEKLDRLVDPADTQREPIWDVTTKPKLFSGGGGLVSTAPDYLRFCQMLLNGGELDGARILKPESVQLMTTNSLPEDIRFGLDFVGPTAGSTWGLGFAIRTDPERSSVPGAVGSYAWSGSGGTVFWVDPAQNLIVVEMVQSLSKSSYRAALRQLIYGALKVPGESPTPFQDKIPEQNLAEYAGTYDFGFSTSAADRQTANVATGIASAGISEGELKVTAVVKGSPANTAEIVPGDLITRIDDEPVKQMSFTQIATKDRGPIGSKVKLEVSSVGQENPREVTLTRAPARSHEIELSVRVDGDKLVAEAVGAWPILDFEKRMPTELEPRSESEFYVAGGDHTRLSFARDPMGRISAAVINRGPWELRGRKVD